VLIIRCISEAQKYQGHLYQAKEKSNKGEAKQQQWTDAISSIETGNPQLKRYIDQVDIFLVVSS
jgi:cell growth-regulating nucleolar protein